MGVTIFGLGVGNEYDINQLNSMATDPDHDHVFRSSNFLHLRWWLSERIKGKVCESTFKSNQITCTLLNARTFQPLMDHIRYIKILTWLPGFQDKNANLLRFFCIIIPKRDLDIKKAPPKIDICPESHGAMLEY